jgi:hypothetical protein
MSQTKEIRELLKQVKQSAEKIKANIQELDEQISELGQRRKTLVNLPLSKEDYLSILRLDIQNKGRLFKDDLRKQLQGSSKITYLAKDKATREGLLISFADAGRFNGQLSVSALHHYFEDDIIKGVEVCLADEQWPTDAMPLSVIESEVAAIDAQIEALSIQRDAIADDLISTGLTE